MLDDAEVKQDKEKALAAAAETQRKVDITAQDLHNAIVRAITSVDRQRRGLKPKRIYLGDNEYSTLRIWSQGNAHWGITKWGRTYMGIDVYRVDETSHTYIAWE